MAGHGKVRTELSKRNKYYISKHRRMELVHFCLQYPEWVRLRDEYECSSIVRRALERLPDNSYDSDPTGESAVKLADVRKKMNMVLAASLEADDQIGSYIFKAVTEGLSFANLKAKNEIPCEKDMFYDRYHKFFWILSKMRD